MRPAAAVAAAAALGLSAAAAHAHNVAEGYPPLAGGLLHPLLVPSHALALVALGLVAGASPMRQRLVSVATFVAATCVSVALVTRAFSAHEAELQLLLLAVASGLLLAAGTRLPLAAACFLAGLAATALIFDSVPAIPSVRDTLISLLASALAAAALLASVAALSAAIPRALRAVAIRVAGAWIAAGALMLLALRFAR